MYLIHIGGPFTNDVHIEGIQKQTKSGRLRGSYKQISPKLGNGVGDPTFKKFFEHHFWLVPKITFI